MSHLTESMVEQFIEVEKENARGVLRKEMDSCMDTIFKQMKRKLMHLVESGRGGDETGHGLAHLGDPVSNHDCEQQQHSSSNSTNRIPSTSINSLAQLSDLNVSNQSYQGGLNDLVYYGQQLYQSSNLIHSTSTNQSHVPDNTTSNQIHDDEITVKNELGEIVDIIPNDESIPPSSTQSQPSNDEQSNDNIDDLFDEEEEKDCDCPDCVGELFVKMEEGDDDPEVDDDDVQLIEDSDDFNPNPTKRHRIDNDDQLQDIANDHSQADSQTNQTQFIIISLKCPQCSQMFHNKNALNAHLKSVHSIEKYRCLYKDCNRSFDIRTQFGDHIRTVHLTQPSTMWPCNYCSGLYKNCSALLNHHLMYHEEGIFQCAYPDCQFVGELKQTVSSHYGVCHKQLVCPYPACTKRFNKANLLKAHEWIHREAKPYRCKWAYCQFDSAYLRNALNHIRKHLAQNRVDGNSTDPKDYLEVRHNLM